MQELQHRLDERLMGEEDLGLGGTEECLVEDKLLPPEQVGVERLDLENLDCINCVAYLIIVQNSSYRHP